MSKSIYLSGPITGESYEDSVGWRQMVAARLMDDVIPLSPMRGKEYLAGDPAIKGDYEAGHRINILSTLPGIIMRDRFDTMVRSDAVLVHLKGAKKVSIGTVVEIGWADAARKPIILIMEKEGNIHEHGFIDQLAGFRTTSIDEACQVANTILSDKFARLRQ